MYTPSVLHNSAQSALFRKIAAAFRDGYSAGIAAWARETTATDLRPRCVCELRLVSMSSAGVAKDCVSRPTLIVSGERELAVVSHHVTRLLPSALAQKASSEPLCDLRVQGRSVLFADIALKRRVLLLRCWPAQLISRQISLHLSLDCTGKNVMPRHAPHFNIGERAADLGCRAHVSLRQKLTARFQDTSRAH